jgi:hypothetical protein
METLVWHLAHPVAPVLAQGVEDVAAEIVDV